MSDYLDRTLGLGYVKSSILLFCGVIAVLAIWRSSTGAIEFEDITTKRNEVFYWLTILVSNTLGIALGDFVATTTGLGFEGWRPCIRWPDRGRRSSTPVHESSRCGTFLGGLCSDAASWGHSRRYFNKTAQPGWHGSQSHYCFYRDHGDNSDRRNSKFEIYRALRGGGDLVDVRPSISG